jgi:hypothetical protein
MAAISICDSTSESDTPDGVGAASRSVAVSTKNLAVRSYLIDSDPVADTADAKVVSSGGIVEVDMSESVSLHCFTNPCILLLTWLPSPDFFEMQQEAGFLGSMYQAEVISAAHQAQSSIKISYFELYVDETGTTRECAEVASAALRPQQSPEVTFLLLRQRFDELGIAIPRVPELSAPQVAALVAMSGFYCPGRAVDVWVRDGWWRGHIVRELAHSVRVPILSGMRTATAQAGDVSLTLLFPGGRAWEMAGPVLLKSTAAIDGSNGFADSESAKEFESEVAAQGSRLFQARLMMRVLCRCLYHIVSPLALSRCAMSLVVLPPTRHVILKARQTLAR